MTMHAADRKTSDLPLTRGGFLRGMGVTLLAGTAAVLMPQQASASARTAAGHPTRLEDDTCYEFCSPSNCGNTGCAGGAHIFTCTGCFDSTMCISGQTCNSFCYQTQPC
jgi:hypothetical protein